MLSSRLIMLLLAGALVATTGLPAVADGLPKGFSYLRDIDPTIVQDMRYAGIHNFLGRRVKGYQAGECILTTRSARALAKVQARLKPKNLSLKVYDCYRPARAVADFVAWAKRPGDTRAKAEFYPTIPKTELFARKYIAKRSKHSRGSTVDLTLVPVPLPPQEDYDPARQRACHHPLLKRFADNSLDMGTGYDCFHRLSHTANPAIKGEAKANRTLLVKEMRRAGFQNYRREWWHFEYINEPYKRTHFDFPVTTPPGAAPHPPMPVREAAAPPPETEPEVPIPAPAAEPPPKLLRISCPPLTGPVPVYDGPSTGHAIVARLAIDANRLPNKGCTGEMTLKQWHALDAIARNSVRPPWCHVLVPGPEGAEPVLKGWIEGRYLIAQSETPRVNCQQ